MKDERFVEDLACELTDAEVLERSDALVAHLGTRDATRARQKAAMKTFKAELEAIDEDVSSLAKSIRTRSEGRDVECIERANYTIDQVEVVRLDTGDVVRCRAFEHDERQLGLELDRKGEMPEPLEDTDEAWEQSAKPSSAAV